MINGTKQLYNASQNGHLLVERLFEANADPNISATVDETTPLHVRGQHEWSPVK